MGTCFIVKLCVSLKDLQDTPHSNSENTPRQHICFGSKVLCNYLQFVSSSLKPASKTGALLRNTLSANRASESLRKLENDSSKYNKKIIIATN